MSSVAEVEAEKNYLRNVLSDYLDRANASPQCIVRAAANYIYAYLGRWEDDEF